MTTTFEKLRLAFHRSLVAVAEFVRVDAELGRQLPEARHRFFGVMEDSSPKDARAQRFLEWFALERPIDGGGGAPIHAFLRSGCPGLEAEFHPFAHSLAESELGVFAVRDEDPDGLELEDAVSEETKLLELPLEDRRVQIGASIIGRLSRIPGSDRWLAFDTVAMYPGLTLFEAFREDAERRRLETAGSADADLSQLDLERVIAASEEAAGERVEDVERELSEFLTPALEQHELPTVAEISYALSTRAHPGSVLGEVLENLAFDTDLDIEHAQRLLLRLWNAHHFSGSAETSDADLPQGPAKLHAPSKELDLAKQSIAAKESIPPEELGPKLLREIEEGLARGEEVESLFERVEAMIEPGAPASGEASDVPEELRWHHQDEGDLEALVTEFLWQREHENHGLETKACERALAIARRLQGLGLREVEQIDDAALGKVLLEIWITDPDDCAAALTDLLLWRDWLVTEHELSISAELDDLHRELSSAAERARDLAARSVVAEDAAPLAWHVAAAEDAWTLTAGRDVRRLAKDLPLADGDLVLGALRGADDPERRPTRPGSPRPLDTGAEQLVTGAQKLDTWRTSRRTSAGPISRCERRLRDSAES